MSLLAETKLPFSKKVKLLILSVCRWVKVKIGFKWVIFHILIVWSSDAVAIISLFKIAILSICFEWPFKSYLWVRLLEVCQTIIFLSIEADIIIDKLEENAIEFILPKCFDSSS